VRQVLLSRRWVVRHVLAIVLVVGCLALGWWQLQRAMSAGGSAQNVGYALQWPLFGGFVVFAWWRMLKIELAALDEQADTEPEAETEPGREAGPGREAEPEPAAEPTVRRSRFPAPVGEQEPDEELAAYNAYLAQLHQKDMRARGRQT
jgi:DNA-binding transcriptional regulator of glucitol operon